MSVMATLQRAGDSWDPIPAPRTCLYVLLHARKMQVSRAYLTMVVMSEVWMVRWVGCFGWCRPMCEWWKGLPVALMSTVRVCVVCCDCQWRIME